MRHKGVRVYHIYRHDDADSGVLRTHVFTFDPLDGSDDEVDGEVTFDVRDLSTWVEPNHPPFLTGKGNTQTNRRAWEKYRQNGTEQKTIKAAIRAALDAGELNPPSHS